MDVFTGTLQHVVIKKKKIVSEVLTAPEMMLSFYETTQCNFLEDSLIFILAAMRTRSVTILS
jgi:hypothetical protein